MLGHIVLFLVIMLSVTGSLSILISMILEPDRVLPVLYFGDDTKLTDENIEYEEYEDHNEYCKEFTYTTIQPKDTESSINDFLDTFDTDELVLEDGYTLN